MSCFFHFLFYRFINHKPQFKQLNLLSFLFLINIIIILDLNLNRLLNTTIFKHFLSILNPKKDMLPCLPRINFLNIARLILVLFDITCPDFTIDVLFIVLRLFKLSLTTFNVDQLYILMISNKGHGFQFEKGFFVFFIVIINFPI